MKWIFAIVMVGILAAGGVYAYQHIFGYEPRSAMEFINAYAAYDELMDAEESYVYVPGQGNNPDRQELNELLNRILAEETELLPAHERLSLSREAQTRLDTLKEEIDLAQSSHAAVYASIDHVETAREKLDSAQLRDQSETVIELMRERQDITARITALQSATNDHAGEILRRIIEEEGELPEVLIIYINDGTEAAEERFDELTRLYSELSIVRERLETEHSQFVAIAL